MPLSTSLARVATALALALACVPGTTVAYAQPASPQPSDSPSPVASTIPSSESTPAASPSPAAQIPIAVDRARAGIVPGATVAVHVTGGAGAISATASAPNVVDVRYDSVAGLLLLVGRAPGNATVTLSDSAGDTATVAVLVAPPGGVVPADVTVELGGTVSPQFAEAQIEAAIAASAQLRPGTQVVVHGATPNTILLPGSGFEATANVRIDGGGAYVDALGTTNVHLRVDTLTELDPQILLYSDDPEKLLADTSGVLYRGTIDAAKPARAYFYHVAYGSSHRLFLSLTATGADARVQILGNAAGPTDAFAYVGHVSTLRYLLERHAQESRIVAVSADAPYLQALGSRELRPGELVAGAFDLRVFVGGPVAVAVIAADTAAQAAALAGGAELPTDGHGRRGEFDLTAVPPLALSLAAGASDPAPFAIGAPTIANLRAGGRALGGDYGVVRNVALQLSNPGAAPASLYFYETPAGGGATTSIWFAGDPAPIEIPCVVRQNRYTVKSFDLAPGETRTVTGEYMTDGASSFPLLFGLTATPPSPPPGPYSPDACNPRTPPPATPSPAGVPIPPPPPTPAPTVTPT